MARTPASRLDGSDRRVLQDMVRFGALASDQVARRYGLDANATSARLQRLRRRGLIDKQPPWLRDVDVYAATRQGARLARVGLREITVSLIHLRHNLAVFDLAECLLAQHPDATWHTERELDRASRHRTLDYRPEHSHRPDGLLVLRGQRIAIELELTPKPWDAYSRICCWYAEQIEVDGVWWFVGQPRIETLLRSALDRHALGPDLRVEIKPLPPEVEVRPWLR